jgi:transketolase
MQVYDSQDAEYKQQVLPTQVRARVAIEAGASFGWHKYTGLDGAVIGIDSFGSSGKAEHLFEHFGFGAQSVVTAALQLLQPRSNA